MPTSCALNFMWNCTTSFWWTFISPQTSVLFLYRKFNAPSPPHKSRHWALTSAYMNYTNLVLNGKIVPLDTDRYLTLPTSIICYNPGVGATWGDGHSCSLCHSPPPPLLQKPLHCSQQARTMENCKYVFIFCLAVRLQTSFRHAYQWTSLWWWNYCIFAYIYMQHTRVAYTQKRNSFQALRGRKD